MDTELIWSEGQIDSLQENWFKSKHPKNNPRGYAEINQYKANIEHENFQSQRIKDLLQLLKIIYLDLSRDTDLYKSGVSKSTDAFEKYLLTDVIQCFPFFAIDKVLLKQHLSESENDFIIWVDQLFNKNKTRVQWNPVFIDYPKISNQSDPNDLSEFTALRQKRILQLAKICTFIDELQFRDYVLNEIKINRFGKLSGNIEGLVYGEKHILSAYLGQFLIRKYPFKDYKGFYSQLWENNSKSVYEHFTPISFFRDLIWVKQSNMHSEYLFDFESDSCRVFQPEEWFSFLWYRYRTIFIHTDEDKELNLKFKSRRPAGDISYQKIAIHHSMDKMWHQVHGISVLKKLVE